MSEFAMLSNMPTKMVGKVKYYSFDNPARFIRTCRLDMTSRKPTGYGMLYASRFKYPKAGLVDCPDWMSGNFCGNGIHGCRLTDSGLRLRVYDHARKFTKWMLMEAETSEVIDISDKIKVPRANVLGVYRNYSDLARAYAKMESKYIID